ncbi:MAG: GTPase Era [Kineosporiaceae bacterium]
MTAVPPGFRSGFACLVGRPNVGKSTLLNAMVGQKVAITSDRPQTTRRMLRGVVHAPDAQLVLVDTPGVHRPRTLLGERLNELTRDAVAEVDVVTLCLPADAAVGPGDRRLAEQVAAAGNPRRRPGVVIAVTRLDLVAREAGARALLAAQELARGTGLEVAEYVPTSGTTGEGVAVLVDVLLALLPAGPPFFEPGQVHDTDVETLVAELVREAALDGVRDELPHSIAVVTEEIVPREGREGRDGDGAEPLTDVRVHLVVERESQKGIVIGRGGARLREVGTRARRGIEGVLGTRVHLDIRVKVARDWQRDPKALNRLGF